MHAATWTHLSAQLWHYISDQAGLAELSLMHGSASTAKQIDETLKFNTNLV